MDALAARRPAGLARAVAVYVDNSHTFVSQASGLYASWSLLRGAHNPIDLLLFHDEHAGELLRPLTLCTRFAGDIRKAHSDCFLIATSATTYGERVVSGISQRYGFLKSIDFLLEDQADFLEDYDYLMKTDCDTFLTPAFARWIPNNFVVGRGKYSGMVETRERIVWWAAKFGYQHAGLFDLGATWYAPPALIREAARIASNLTVLLHEQAFNEFTEWPRWHRGVASMYAQEIAINHVAPDCEPSDLIDFPSHHAGYINQVYHIHCFHAMNFFSKSAYASGWYDGVNTTGWDTTLIKVFALEMALRGDGLRPFNSFIVMSPDGIAGSVKPNFTALDLDPKQRGPGFSFTMKET